MRAGLWVLVLAGCGQDPADDGVDTSGSVPAMVVSADVEVRSDGLVTCDDPTLRDSVRFDRRQGPVPPNSEIWVWASGMISADLDEDGNLDVLTPSETTARIYWGNPTGTFVEETLDEHDLSWGIGGNAVDYDGDGDLDLYVTRYAQPNVLLRNDGDRVFVDVTAEVGGACLIPDGAGGWKGGMSMASTWADYDRDGDLDLFVGNYGYVDHSKDSAALFGPAEPDCLFHNEDGKLVDVTAEVLPYDVFHPLHDGYEYVAAWQDLDDDGWPELYAVNDFGTAFPNRLVWNHEGTLALDNGLHLLDVPITGMGMGINDLNGDGTPDFVIPIWNNIRVMHSAVAGDNLLWAEIPNGNGIQRSEALDQKVGWGAELEDLDNDADIDAVVAFGFVDDLGNPIWDNPFRQPDAIYLNDGAGTFTDQASAWGVADTGVGRGFVLADFNRDGWLDLAKRDIVGPNVFYVSHCGTEGWLTVALRDETTRNTRGIGAKVTVTDGETTQVRWLRAGGTSHAVGGPPEVHFGLGAIEGVVDRVEIRWPDGSTSTLENVEPRQHLVVTRSGS